MKTSLLIALVTLMLLAGCASQTQQAAPADQGPKPDARFQLTTTSISTGMGLSWADGRLGDNYMDYKFSVEALTLNEWENRFARSGQQITLYGNVYNLKHVPDFAGTYTGATPGVASSVWGSARDRVFQNEKGVIVRITGRFIPGAAGMGDDFDVQLLKDNFTVKFREF